MSPRLIRLFLIPATLMTLLVISASPASAAPGDLDLTFGSGGTVTTVIGPNANAEAVAIQPDGKVVAAGYSSGEGGNVFALARYTANGTLDSTFGSGGTVTTPIGSSSDIASAVVLQSDGKIVAVGYSAKGNFSDYDFALARYTAAGALDSTFGTGGIVTTPIGSADDHAWGAAIQSDGKIVVAGQSFTSPSESDAVVARYTSDGDLDSAFGTGGIVTTDIGPLDGLSDVAIQPDGKIVGAGFGLIDDNSESVLVRYTDAGDLDPTFGTGGIVTTITEAQDSAIAMALQPDGKIVAAGTSDNNGDPDFAVARFTSDGVLDTTFGTDGIATTPIRIWDALGAVAVQSDGKIVASGNSADGDFAYDLALVRYTSDGALDSTFGTGGKVTTPVGDGDESAQALAIQPNGKIVAAGWSVTGTGSVGFALARYMGDAGVENVLVNPEASLGSTGRITVRGGTTCGPAGDTFRMLVVVRQESTEAITRIGAANRTCSGETSTSWTVTPRKKAGSPAFQPGAAEVCWEVRSYSGSTQTDRVRSCDAVTLGTP